MAKGKNRKYAEGRVVWLIGFIHEDDFAEVVKRETERGVNIWSTHLDNLPKEYGGAIYTVIGLLPDEKAQTT